MSACESVPTTSTLTSKSLFANTQGFVKLGGTALARRRISEQLGVPSRNCRARRSIDRGVGVLIRAEENGSVNGRMLVKPEGR